MSPFDPFASLMCKGFLTLFREEIIYTIFLWLQKGYCLNEEKARVRNIGGKKGLV